MEILEHPEITRALETGYPRPVPDGFESFGLNNCIICGDLCDGCVCDDYGCVCDDCREQRTNPDWLARACEHFDSTDTVSVPAVYAYILTEDEISRAIAEYLARWRKGDADVLDKCREFIANDDDWFITACKEVKL